MMQTAMASSTRTLVTHGKRNAELPKARVSFQLCAFTACNNWWVNLDLLPGVEVGNDVLLQIINLAQEGYVQIQP
jgi:intracellular sulfur oxidation DsrE/DsrF family protein